jgi:hypothetical protein
MLALILETIVLHNIVMGAFRRDREMGSGEVWAFVNEGWCDGDQFLVNRRLFPHINCIVPKKSMSAIYQPLEVLECV